MDYEKKYNEALKLAASYYGDGANEFLDTIFPELAESEDERVRKWIIGEIKTTYDFESPSLNPMVEKALAYLEKQKENPKSADSIPSDCVSDAKCENRWHKVGDSLPDNGRLVLANDCLGNILLARYDGEGNWEVSVYDNEDYYCRNTITKWCEIPSEKQKEQKPAEWGEEDEIRRESCMLYLANARDSITFSQYIEDNAKESGKKEIQKDIDWLKSLRNRPKPSDNWKPSEEHLSALLAIFNDPNNISSQTCQLALTDLYEQLKKLV